MAAFSYHDKPDLYSIRVLVLSINEHVHDLLSIPETRLSLNSKCKSHLKSQTNQYFEFNDHSVLSNLYWGIECIESAIETECHDEKTDKLRSCEEMLQVPALLDEHGVTSGILNQYLVCFSYFYLSIVRKLRGDEVQVALHFLQALLVSPRTVVSLVAPGLCESLFPLGVLRERKILIRRNDEDDDDEAMRKMARRWKDRLMYYQVMLFGETRFLADESPRSGYEKTNSTRSYHGNTMCFEKMHLLDPTENSPDKTSSNNPNHSKNIQEFEEYIKAFAELDNQFFSNNCYNTNENSKLKCLDDMLDDTQSETPMSRASYDKYSSMEDDSEDSLNCSEVSKKPPLILAKIYSSISYQETEKLRTNPSENICLVPEKNPNRELVVTMEKAISKLSFNGPLRCSEDYSSELTAMYKTLQNKFGSNYTLIKNAIIDILLTGISTSKDVGIIRASVSILTTLVSEKKSSIEDVKRKGLRLSDLANALKRRVDEAAILTYLTNPSAKEIMHFDLLPILLEIICSSKTRKSCQNRRSVMPLLPSPPKASVLIIEILVTSYDYAMNGLHLAAISTPQVLSCLVDLAQEAERDECIAFATILVKSMRFDGRSRKYLAHHAPVEPFLRLLKSKKKTAKSIGLEFFHEILHIPRSFAIGLLQIIKTEGNISNIMHLLRVCIQELQSEYKLLAADLLLQLDMLDDSSDKSICREEAMKVILESLSSPQSSTQQLSAFLLANMGGTYSWIGEPYTVPWLIKRAGLNSPRHRNMIKSFDWFDQALQDSAMDKWSSKIAKMLIWVGKPVFLALEIGLRSKIKRVSLDCFTVISWLGYEAAKSPNGVIRDCACDILLGRIEQFLHPGSELEERVLACLCIYNYTSGKGKQKLINFSEGVRESLRRLSSITWMAEELLKVADFFQPNKSRISCVHTQVLEASHCHGGAVMALIYYKGLLFSGYSDGSIRVWDIKGQSTKLVLELKEHKKALTCFSLYEPGDSLLSGSMDKTIRLWQMAHNKLECTEVITMKEPVQSIDTYGQSVYVITQSHSMKVFDESRIIKDAYKGKKVKCMRVVSGKVYIGCIDSSIQELTIRTNVKKEIKEPVTSWRMQTRPINSIVVFKNWMYSASTSVEGSNFKEWRGHDKPQVCITSGTTFLAMGVVEDFIYLNCASSKNTIQIWLRGSQQKVGRLSAGSRITSLLTANDVVICGTESGLIKGWIPL